MATIQRITVEIGRLATLYRHPMTPVELKTIQEAWFELLAGLSDSDLIAAVREHLRHSRFFPCPADILRENDEARPDVPSMPALPEQDHSPESLHRNAVNAAMARLGLKNEQAREFFNLADWQQKDAMERQFLGERYPGAQVRPDSSVMHSARVILRGARRQQ